MPEEPGKLYKLALTIPWIKRSDRPAFCEGLVWGRRSGDGQCIKVAYWDYTVAYSSRVRIFCWPHLWRELKADPRLEPWLRVRQSKPIHVETVKHRQLEMDLQISMTALTETHGLGGDMALDAFDRAADEAWDRLTPRQQGIVMSRALDYLGRQS
jgi:hypothetical protein